jgi:hypothetical protein
MLISEAHEPLLPFPSLPETVKARHLQSALALRPFGFCESDLNLDFEHTPRPLLVTRILECCTRHTDNEPVAQDFFWALPIGKRIECLLLLWSFGTGHEISFGFRCPNETCKQDSEVQITVAEIADLQEQAYRSEHVMASLSDDSSPGASLVLRRPTGGDQLAWLQNRFVNQDEASRAMLGMLLLENKETLIRDEWIADSERALEKHDPLINFSLLVECSECGGRNLLELDLEELSIGGLRKAQLRLLASVHRLAAKYHWSEEQIFSVPYWRRAYYLRLIEEEEN